MNVYKAISAKIFPKKRLIELKLKAFVYNYMYCDL